MMVLSDSPTAFLSLVALLAATGFAGAENVPVIRATQNRIILGRLSCDGAMRSIALYELAPNEPDDAWKTKEPLLVRDVGASGNMSISIPRFDDYDNRRRDRIYSKFVVVPTTGSQADPVMSARFVEDTSAATRRVRPFPKTRSKKGLQVQMIDDAIRLGVQHAALNVLLPRLIAWDPSPDDIPYEMDGETFHFGRREVSDLDRRIKALSDAGAVVTLVLLNPARAGGSRKSRVFRHPRYNPACPNHYSAFNTVTDDGLKYFKAVVEFLIDRYTRPGHEYGEALNYIVGNEVNSHWWWSNMGEVSMEDFVEDYLRTVRIASMAARKTCSAARVYISLEHHWTTAFSDDEKKAFPGRPFLDRFARRAREQGDFPWGLAFHCYPSNLWEPASWLDKDATYNFDTPKITFKNIELLPAYFRRPELLYRGRQRHIILSEQGFHTKDGEDGEVLQAAAFCYAYYKVAHLDGIDSFIFYRHVDHRGEAGLRFGLWTRKKNTSCEPDRKKRIYEVFRLADSSRWKKAFAFAKPIIGIDEWSELLARPPKEQSPAPRPTDPRSESPRIGRPDPDCELLPAEGTAVSSGKGRDRFTHSSQRRGR